MSLHSNPLEGQKSPYLLQHAHNPVNWYPWCDQAFKKAADEGKPIFLSIGYATCHWCHVMEKESFENDEVAETLNKSFISIKVDREERPDIDNVYMSVCQALTGTGGWPLTIIMTPDKKPFFAATYIPRESRFGMTGLLEILPKIADLWKDKKADVLSSAEKVSAALKGNSDKTFAAEVGAGLCVKAVEEISSEFDRTHGGFGNAPKFPSAHRLLFLLRQAKVSGDKEILRQVEFTLDKMRAGGIYDQLGGGFHRYSTDAKWLLPHFEKMLYDQAMLVMAYVEACQISGKEEYADTARDVIGYVLRDMTSPEGAFYSAEDADSEGEEGKFYVWKYKEVFSVLGNDEALVAVRYFNVDAQGNYTDPIHGASANNILYLSYSVEKIASEFDKTVPEMKLIIAGIRSKMLDYRGRRARPLRDTKILADWNGLMIAAVAKSAGLLDSESHLKA
ncbi:MAG: thioredoxin domain-containing protein, partial [Victivallales bacterium]